MAFAQAAGWGNPPFAQPTSYNANAQLSCTKNDLFPEDQVYGLRILHTPQNASTGDIIFLHGLTGNSYDTWTSRKGVYWPTELLTNDFPNVRIMAFGYDADVTRLLGPVSKNNSAEAHERQLHDRTITIAFCGTPHRGSGIASFATSVAHNLKAAHKRVNTDILALLKRDSEVLAEIDAMFSVWLRKKGKKFTLTCFSEEHELPGVVGKESSKIGGYPQYSIPANHMDMVRFNSQEDIGYRRIKGELQRWIRDGFTGERSTLQVEPCKNCY
ncbi:hypothetical protein QBC43DRAFT_293131 [Cladorrhinum sp. PSN259]|nr:hypothetical protein QBC43DRAFT_293131 [Cladorrhinum sp. PSN259]